MFRGKAMKVKQARKKENLITDIAKIRKAHV